MASLTEEQTAPQIRRFTAADCVLGSIEKVVAMDKPAVVAAGDAGKAWVDPARGRYALNTSQLRDFLQTPSRQASIRHGARAWHPMEWRPLEELLWQAAFHGSRGALLDRCQPYDVIRLQYWPNFPRLPHTTGMLSLCALLAARPASLSFAHRAVRTNQAEAVQFYSAAMASGAIRVTGSQPPTRGAEEPSEPDASIPQDRLTGFWGAIFKRLANL